MKQLQQGTDPTLWQEYCDLFHKFTFSIQHELLDYAAEKADGKVLDAGSGTGKLLPKVMKKDSIESLIAMENNEFMFERLNQTVDEELTSDQRRKVIAHRSDINNLERVIAEPQDTIVCLNVLYALNEDPKEFLKQAYENLGEGGKLIVSNPLPNINLAQDIFPRLDQEVEPQDEADYQRFQELNEQLIGRDTNFIPHLYTPTEIEGILTEIGFGIEELRTDHYFGSSVTVVATKPF